jgi:phosphoribosylaminoimidazolecarboxamide formyltransferase/IMP cyclohydrolase
MNRTALISVYNKDGIEDFAKALIELGFNIISSGGTARKLLDTGIPVRDVAEISGLKAILGHRVVTLVPQVHGGLLATEEQREELDNLGYPWIDLACVDFYSLKKEIEKMGATRQSVVEMTDIGGPTMVRSAAKGRRIVVVRAKRRQQVIEWLKAGEPNSEERRVSE